MNITSDTLFKMSQPRLVLDRVCVPISNAMPDPIGFVSLSLAQGRCLALFSRIEDRGGILLDIISGHAHQSSGRVLLDGRDLGFLPPEVRGIGLVSIRDPLFLHLDVVGNIAFPLHVRRVAAGEINQRVHDSVALLGLEAVAGRRLSTLNASQQIRVKIARALVFSPSLLLLDAPFADLGSVDRVALQRSLRRLTRARGLTVLLTTADRDEAFLLGDEIGVLAAGRLHQVGSAAILLDRPTGQVVAERIGDANLLIGQIICIHDEVALVRLANGAKMEAQLGEPLDVDTPCVLCVRPDRIATIFLSGLDQSSSSDMIAATLLEAVHFGDHLRLRFRLSDGGEILVRRPPAASMADLRPDRIAMLAWQPHQAQVFARSA